MNLSLDDIATFYFVIREGGFSHAAKVLNVSNGSITRRIQELESKLAVSLINRTTRQLKLTAEGEVLWQHAQRIHQELDSALSLIKTSASKPKGTIRLSAPLYFGRQYLIPILIRFQQDFTDIKIDLNLGNKNFDLIKDKFDLVIRGKGYLDNTPMKNSSMHAKLLIKEKIGLYVAPKYILKYGEPKSVEELNSRVIVTHSTGHGIGDKIKWKFTYKNKNEFICLNTSFNCNDIGGTLFACLHGYGIGRFTDFNVKKVLNNGQLKAILTQYNWGEYYLYALYSKQQALPKRTRLLLDFIASYIKTTKLD